MESSAPDRPGREAVLPPMDAMPASFDPYTDWLGITDARRPPDHYTLLGIPRLESDAQVIAHAADVRMAKVRKIRPGQNAAEWGRLLDQLGAAKVCLSDQASRAAYDRSLTQPVRAAEPVASDAPTTPTLGSEPAVVVASEKAGRRLPVGLLLSVLVGLGIGGAFLLANTDRRSADQPPVPSAASIAQPPRQPDPEPSDPTGQPPETVAMAPRQPEEPDEPEEQTPPPEQPATQPQVDPAQQAAFSRAASDALAAMAERDLQAAGRHLEKLGADAQTPEQRTQAELLATVSNYLGQFFNGLRDSVAELESGAELAVGETRVVIVEADRQQLTVKTAGRIRTWQVEQLPMSIIMTLVDQTFGKDPGTKTIVGTFHAVDAKGDRKHARRLWQEAAQGGVRVELLLPLLGMAPKGGRSANLDPPPSKTQIRKALRTLREEFKQSYAEASDKASRLELARELLARAKTVTAAPAVRFVMLAEARDMAATLGEPALAVEAVERMADFYSIDVLQEKASALEKSARRARGPEAQLVIARGLLEVLEQAVKAGRLDEATQLVKKALAAARKTRDPQLIEQAVKAVGQIQSLRQQQ